MKLKKRQMSWFVFGFCLGGLFLLLMGTLNENWYHLVGGFLLMILSYDRIRIVHYHGELDE